MTDITRARGLFRKAGLAFPTVPEDLASQLKERSPWVFSTRPIDISPYNLEYYVGEAKKNQVADYAVVSHSGHGINSYAIQYYLVHGFLRMFLHLGWGGVYMDKEKYTAKINDCFSKADKISQTAIQCAVGFQAGEHLTVVASDFYGSHWVPPGLGHRGKEIDRGVSSKIMPLETLIEVLDWLA